MISNGFGFVEVSDLGKYLGVPVLHRWVTTASYQYLIRSVEQKLSGWKARTPLLAGRIVLAKSALAAIPTYTLQTAVLLESTCLAIERIIHRFIWGSTSSRGGIHLVKWQDVCKPISDGGLGFRKIDKLNNIFLIKLAFHIITKRESLWVRFIRTKYKCDQGVPLELCNFTCSRLWKGLSIVWNDVRSTLIYSIGSSTDTDFWFDLWIVDIGPLVEHVNTEYISSIQHMSVASMAASNGDWRWQEFDHLLPLDVILRIARIKTLDNRLSSDTIGWRGDKNIIFSVKFAYN
ncbi:uncharacterized mitochondrial protein AtMg00310-like [Hibiscus syriacus]|uniref:uncharacterized mitochondrial protein AtMg00310-like n=1 Tax=Hibiscus syriacus TaxID=106335 RepID=UPI001923BBA3|nr:uncharacterized mitochondrial protein AtMg00310-like [Hibiscus syriacus]